MTAGRKSHSVKRGAQQRARTIRYYMVFENEENLLPGAVSMSQFIDTVKAL